MSNTADADAQRNDDEMPDTEELDEPSTEKSPDEEPTAETPLDPEPDHEAVGIGVIDGPQTDTDRPDAQ